MTYKGTRKRKIVYIQLSVRKRSVGGELVVIAASFTPSVIRQNKSRSRMYVAQTIPAEDCIEGKPIDYSDLLRILSEELVKAGCDADAIAAAYARYLPIALLEKP